ncbi:TMPK1 [Auxenochlorella protothecoides x Auxenochlorella symbiontica]
MTRSPARGALIVFEGVDRAGKSTQCELLSQHLGHLGYNVELWRFPDRSTAIGSMINSYLTKQSEADDAAMHLLFSANRWEKRAAMLERLNSGTTLIVDRYAHSGVAFTAAKGLPGLDTAWCRAPDVGLPAPDTVFFLDLSPEQAAERGGYGQERYETTDLQKKVRQAFGTLQDPSWVVVDAARSVETVQAEIAEESERILSRCEAGVPLGTLWPSA